MKTIFSVWMHLGWFIGQFTALVGLGYLISKPHAVPPREHLLAIFTIHTIFWGVMQIGILHAKLNKMACGVTLVREDLCNLPSSDSRKW